MTFLHKGFDEIRRLGLRSETEQVHTIPSYHHLGHQLSSWCSLTPYKMLSLDRVGGSTCISNWGNRNACCRFCGECIALL